MHFAVLARRGWADAGEIRKRPAKIATLCRVLRRFIGSSEQSQCKLGLSGRCPAMVAAISAKPDAQDRVASQNRDRCLSVCAARSFDGGTAASLPKIFAITLPIIVALGRAITLESPGPVLDCETIIGNDGRRFQMVKFRTTAQGPEQQQSAVGPIPDPSWFIPGADAY